MQEKEIAIVELDEYDVIQINVLTKEGHWIPTKAYIDDREFLKGDPKEICRYPLVLKIMLYGQ